MLQHEVDMLQHEVAHEPRTVERLRLAVKSHQREDSWHQDGENPPRLRVESQQNKPERERRRVEWQRLEVEHEWREPSCVVNGLGLLRNTAESQRREGDSQQREVAGLELRAAVPRCEATPRKPRDHLNLSRVEKNRAAQSPALRTRFGSSIASSLNACLPLS